MASCLYSDLSMRRCAAVKCTGGSWLYEVATSGCEWNIRCDARAAKELDRLGAEVPYMGTGSVLSSLSRCCMMQWSSMIVCRSLLCGGGELSPRLSQPQLHRTVSDNTVI